MPGMALMDISHELAIGYGKDSRLSLVTPDRNREEEPVGLGSVILLASSRSCNVQHNRPGIELPTGNAAAHCSCPWGQEKAKYTLTTFSRRLQEFFERKTRNSAWSNVAAG
jgi:hypothetical protein